MSIQSEAVLEKPDLSLHFSKWIMSISKLRKKIIFSKFQTAVGDTTQP